MKMKKILLSIFTLMLCFSMAACTLNQSGNDTKVKEEVTDVVVVGGGVSGLNAAIFAAQNGAKVTLVEKQGMLGGSGLVSSGYLFTVNSNGLINGDDSIEHAFSFWKPTAELGSKKSGYPNWDRLEYTLEKTGETVNKLVELGVTIANAMSIPTGSMVGIEGGGAGYTSKLTEIVKSQSVDVLLNTKATELVVEDDVVVGVKVSSEEGEKIFKAKTVILATGGYALDEEKVAEWTPDAKFVYNGRIASGDTGDGFDMALKVGAALYENQCLMISTTMPEAEYNRLDKAVSVLSLGNSLVVSPEGKRFVNENPAAYSEFGNVMIDNQIEFCYALMNATNDNKAVLESGMERGEVVKAASIEELATTLAINPTVLQETFDHYNQLCANGNDDDFNKATANLIALEESEIYAVKYYSTSIGTIGGVKTNKNHEVLRGDGTVIEGLLAIGEMSNREFYNYYYVGGASLGLYSTMGRLAGEYAAQRVTE